jgi:hypothetical protein
MIDPLITGPGLKASVILSEIRLRAELNCACLVSAPFTPTRYRSQTHGTGRLRARRRFGYWREQIGHLCDQSGHHFGARRLNSSPQPRVSVETAIETLSLPVVRRLIAKEKNNTRRGFEPSAPARHSCVRPSFPRNARMAGKIRHFAYSISSPADPEVQIAESLWP